MKTKLRNKLLKFDETQLFILLLITGIFWIVSSIQHIIAYPTDKVLVPIASIFCICQVLLLFSTLSRKNIKQNIYISNIF